MIESFIEWQSCAPWIFLIFWFLINLLYNFVLDYIFKKKEKEKKNIGEFFTYQKGILVHVLYVYLVHSGRTAKEVTLIYRHQSELIECCG